NRGKPDKSKKSQRLFQFSLGKSCYIQTLGFGDWYFKDHETYVFSRTGVKIESPRTRHVDGDPVAFVRTLKATRGKNIWLLGGGELNWLFLNHNLIDEIMLSVQPICLGSGIGLFGGRRTDAAINFKLAGSKPFLNGAILLHYKRGDTIPAEANGGEQ
ncbi:MAG: hypothetical protein C5B49_10390, partial [Bdellovibrio sp.]